MIREVQNSFLKTMRLVLALVVLLLSFDVFAGSYIETDITQSKSDSLSGVLYRYRTDPCAVKIPQKEPEMSEATVCENCDKGLLSGSQSQNKYFIENSKAFKKRIAEDQGQTTDELNFYKYLKEPSDYSLKNAKKGYKSNKERYEKISAEVETTKKIIDSRKRQIQAIESYISSQTPIPKEIKEEMQDFTLKLAAENIATKPVIDEQIDQYRYILQSHFADAKSKTTDWVNKLFDKEIIELSQKNIEVNETVKASRDIKEFFANLNGAKFSPESYYKILYLIQNLKDSLMSNEKQLAISKDNLDYLQLSMQTYKQKLEAPKKLKNEKITPSEQLEAYEALFKMPMTDESRCELSAAEKYSFYDYSQDGYREINFDLRNHGDNNKVQGYTKTLNAALEKLKPFEGNVYRGADLPFDVLDEHQVGATVTYPAYTSASAVAGFTNFHMFTIKSKTGRYIAPFSSHPIEDEVLFKPGTQFKVLSRFEKGRHIEFVMEEVDP